MTAAAVLQAVCRRWYVVATALVAGMVFTVLLGVSGGVYATQTVVQFIHVEPSQSAINPNSDIENGNFIAFAGAVASEVNNGRPAEGYAWETAPLYGAGIRQGVRVALPDSGGQWMRSYNRAELVIQVVGPTRDWVQVRQQQLLDKVAESSRSLQGSAYNSRQSIRTSVVPLTTTIEHVTASRGQQLAAILAVMIAAVVVGGWVAVRVDERHPREELGADAQGRAPKQSVQVGAS